MSGSGLSQWHCLLQVAVSGARLLARLSVVGAVARFQEAAEELARMHALNATPDSPSTQVQPLMKTPWRKRHVIEDALV